MIRGGSGAVGDNGIRGSSNSNCTCSNSKS